MLVSQFLFYLFIIIISGAFAWIQQTSYINEEGVVSFDESLIGNDVIEGGSLNCTSYYGSGILKSLNVSFYFNSNGDPEAWPSDMYILFEADSKCYTYGGYDDDVSFHELNIL